jgi:hypothetical protein
VTHFAFSELINIDPTDIAGTTVVVTGLSFEPKVVIFWWNGRSDAGASDASGAGTHRLGVGFAVSSSDRRCVTTLSVNGAATSITKRGHYNDACVVILDDTGAVDGILDFQSMDSDGFTLVVDDQFSTAFRVHCLALGGTDITDVATGQFQEPGATGNQDITSLSFKPDFIFPISVGETAAPNATGADSTISIGAAISSTKQGVVAGGANDAVTTSQAVKYGTQGSGCITLFNSGVSAIDAEASLSEFLPNGFRLNWSSRASTRYIHFLAIKGGSYDIGEITTLTDTVTDIVITNGFLPSGGMILSHMSTESASIGVSQQLSLGIWNFLGTTRRAVLSVSDRDAVGTTDVNTSSMWTEVYRNEATAGGTLIALMDIKSIQTDGFTCIMDDAESGNRFAWHVTFGAALPGHPVQLRGTQVKGLRQWTPQRFGR